MFDHPLESAQFVVSTAVHVTCNAQGSLEAARHLFGVLREQGTLQNEKSKDEYLPEGLSDTEKLHWVFLLDTLNFCFWANHGDPMFGVCLNGRLHTGYRGLAAAIRRAYNDGVPVCQSLFYDTISEEKLCHILRSDTEGTIPLLKERWMNISEACSVLKEKFGGSLEKLVSSANNEAWHLVEIVADSFPSYRDVIMYKGRTISMLKRAQIFVSDLWFIFQGKSFGDLKGLEKLTMFADYRVPQSLQYFNVLKYSSDLLEKLKRGEVLSAGSDYEVEIRASSIWAVELIRQQLSQLVSGDDSLKGVPCPKSVEIDYYLWKFAKSHAEEMDHLPIHHTRTIYY